MNQPHIEERRLLIQGRQVIDEKAADRRVQARDYADLLRNSADLLRRSERGELEDYERSECEEHAAALEALADHLTA